MKHQYYTRNTHRIIVALLLAITLSACSGAAERQSFSQAMRAGNWQESAKLATESSGLPYKEIAAGTVNPANLKPKALNWSFDAGLAWLNSGNYTATDRVFSAAENLMRETDTQSLAAGIGSTSLSVIAGEKTDSYKYSGYEGILTNSYKALALFLNKDFNNARIELNRAGARENIVRENVSARVEKERAQANKDKNSTSRGIFDGFWQKIIGVPEVKAFEDKLRSQASYGLYVNPFTTWLRGIERLAIEQNNGTSGGIERAVDDLKETAKIIGETPLLKADLKFANDLATGHKQKRAWLIFENGSAPIQQGKVYPIPFVNHEGKFVETYVGVPMLFFNARPYDAVNVVFSNGQSVKTETIADMDRVIGREFYDRFAARMNIAVAGAIVRGLASTSLDMSSDKKKNETTFDVGTLLMAVGSMVVNNAAATTDDRTWLSLPAEYQAAGFTPPADGKLVIRSQDGQIIANVTIPPDQISLIYLKKPTRTAASSVHIASIAVGR